MIRTIARVEHNRSHVVEKPRWSKLTTTNGDTVWHDTYGKKTCPSVGDYAICIRIGATTYTKKEY